MGRPVIEPSRDSYCGSHLDPVKVLAYDRDLLDPRAAKGIEWQLEQRILDELLAQRPGPDMAIDFACGTGRVLGFLANRARRVIGVDISAAMLEVARQRYPQARLIHGDITVTPGLLTESADVITAFRFLLNAEPPLRASALEWMRDRLAPEGALIVNFHLNPRSLRGRYLSLRRAPDVKMIGVPEACDLLAGHGLVARRIRAYSFLPYRRDGSRLALPHLRRRIESRLADIDSLTSFGSCFAILAERDHAQPSTGEAREG
jgi:SAM-dependent methyltransferase